MDVAMSASCQQKPEALIVGLPVKTEPVGGVVQSNFILFEDCG